MSIERGSSSSSSGGSSALIPSQLSAFGEQKVVIDSAQSGWKATTTLNQELYSDLSSNGGSVVLNDGFFDIASGTASNGVGYHACSRALRYEPRKGGLCAFTAVYSSPVADNNQLIGIGDSQDGFFIGYIGLVFGYLRRRAGVDYFTPIEEFTEDTVFEGFNPQKLNVYQINFQWLGGGEIKVFLENPSIGLLQLIHRDKYANSETDTSIKDPTLTPAAICENTGNTTNVILRSPSMAATLEGSDDSKAYVVTLGLERRNISYSSSAEVPLLTLRNNTEFPTGKTNRVRLRLAILSAAADPTGNKIVNFRLVKNGTLGGPTSYTDLDPNRTPAQQDIGSTTITGGQLIIPFEVSPSGGSVFQGKGDIDIDIAPGDHVTVTGQSAGAAIITVGFTYETLL